MTRHDLSRPRIVLAFSSGLKSIAALASLLDHAGAELVTVAVDLGEGRALESVRDRAFSAGAVRAHVVDACDEFARHYVLPSLHAGATLASGAPLAAALGRLVVAQKLVEVARIEGATVVAHGCLGEDADAMRGLIASIDPSIRVAAPVADLRLDRSQLLEYVRLRNAPLGAAAAQRESADVNLWGRSARECVDDALTPAETRRSVERVGTPARVDVAFDAGTPTSINGVTFSPVELIAALDTIASAHQVGRFRMIQARSNGQSSWNRCDAPAATVLHRAHDDLQRFVTSDDLAESMTGLAAEYADLIARGAWHTPARRAMDARVAAVQPRVTGSVTLLLSQGDCASIDITSPFAMKDAGRGASTPGVLTVPAASPGAASASRVFTKS